MTDDVARARWWRDGNGQLLGIFTHGDDFVRHFQNSIPKSAERLVADLMTPGIR